MSYFNRSTWLLSLLALAVVVSGGTGLYGQESGVSFVNTVAIGDSYTAGMQNGVLKSGGQQTGYISLASRQIQTYLFQPLIPDPGFGSEVSIVDGGIVIGEPTTSTRTFPLVIPQNLAVPAQGVVEALTVRPELPLDTLEDIILGLPILVVPLGIPPASQIELGVGLQPTFTFFWLGFNDLLGKAVYGLEPLPFPVLQEAYTTALGGILTLTSTKIVIGNIPDVTVIPYLTSAEEIAYQAGAPLDLIGPLLGIGAGDFVRLPAMPLVSAILNQQAPGPLPAEAVLTATEVGELKLLTAQMNGLIAGIAGQFGVPVVDIHSAWNEADTQGLAVGDATLTTFFLGGVYSLDGIHLTNTGNAWTANLFLDAINNAYGTEIPLVDVEAVAANDPLIFPPPEGAAGIETVMAAGSDSLYRMTPLLWSARTIETPSPDGQTPPISWEELTERMRFFSTLGIRSEEVSTETHWNQRRGRTRRAGRP